MIPKWQWAGIIALLALLVGVAIYSAPNSFANLVLAGKCDSAPVPAACTPKGRGGGGSARSW